MNNFSNSSSSYFKKSRPRTFLGNTYDYHDKWTHMCVYDSLRLLELKNLWRKFKRELVQIVVNILCIKYSRRRLDFSNFEDNIFSENGLVPEYLRLMSLISNGNVVNVFLAQNDILTLYGLYMRLPCMNMVFWYKIFDIIFANFSLVPVEDI